MFFKDEDKILDILHSFEDTGKITKAGEFELLIAELIKNNKNYLQQKELGLVNIENEVDHQIKMLDIASNAIKIINSARTEILGKIELKPNYAQIMFEFLAAFYMGFENIIKGLNELAEENPDQDEKIANMLNAYSLRNTLKAEFDNLLGDFFYKAFKESIISYTEKNIQDAEVKNTLAFKIAQPAAVSTMRDIVEKKGSLTYNLITYSPSKNAVVIKLNHEKKCYEVYGLYVANKTVIQLFAELNVLYNPDKACFEMRIEDMLAGGDFVDKQAAFNKNSNCFKFLEIFFSVIHWVYFYDRDEVFYNNFLDEQSRAKPSLLSGVHTSGSASNPS